MKQKRSLPHSGHRTVVEQVTAVYEKLEGRRIERDCRARTICCRFRLTGEVPYLTRGEALVAARAWRATGRKVLPGEKESEGNCPFLDLSNGHCRIYRQRPFPCRTHFCSSAGGPYRRSEVSDLIRELEEIDRAIGGEGIGRGLRMAVTAELDRL